MQFEKSPRCCAQLHPGCNLHKNKLENKAEFIFEYQTLKNAVNKSWLNEENHIPFVQNYAPNDVLERKFYLEVNIDFDQWFKMIDRQKLGQRKSLDFNWILFHGHINTEIGLEKVKLSYGYCKLCNTTRENLDHILKKCSHILDVWVRIEQLVHCLGETDYMTDFNKIIGYMKDGKLHSNSNSK